MQHANFETIPLSEFRKIILTVTEDPREIFARDGKEHSREMHFETVRKFMPDLAARLNSVSWDASPLNEGDTQAQARHGEQVASEMQAMTRQLPSVDVQYITAAAVSVSASLEKMQRKTDKAEILIARESANRLVALNLAPGTMLHTMCGGHGAFQSVREFRAYLLQTSDDVVILHLVRPDGTLRATPREVCVAMSFYIERYHGPPIRPETAAVIAALVTAGIVIPITHFYHAKKMWDDIAENLDASDLKGDLKGALGFIGGLAGLARHIKRTSGDKSIVGEAVTHLVAAKLISFD
jgi:hypothetical protein